MESNSGKKAGEQKTEVAVGVVPNSETTKTQKIEENYCIYCKLTEKRIRRLNRQSGYRVPCSCRPTLKGFHSFGRRVVNNE